MNINRSNTTDYHYNLYVDYINQLDEVLIKYSHQTGISIQYWHIIIELSKNFDNLNLMNSYKHFVYDVYNFIPTINMTPLTYQIGYDGQMQGTTNKSTGSFSMYLISDPLPGDMIRFYSPMKSPITKNSSELLMLDI